MSYGELSNTQETMVLPMLQMKNIRGKPYITVSAKGMINGLSNIPNDGADFGPDTTKGAKSRGQYGSPYTETSGAQEGYNYASSLGGNRIKLSAGIFKLSSAITLLANSSTGNNSVDIEGEGQGVTVLQAQSSGMSIIYGDLSGTIFNSSFREFAIDANGLAAYGINVTMTETSCNNYFDRLLLKGVFSNTAFNLSGSEDTEIHNVSCGIYGQPQNTLDFNINNVDGNIILDNYRSFGTGNTLTAQTITVSNSTLNSVTVDQTFYANLSKLYFNQSSGNQIIIKGPGAVAIDSIYAQTNVSGNYIVSNEATGTSIAITNSYLALGNGGILVYTTEPVRTVSVDHCYISAGTCTLFSGSSGSFYIASSFTNSYLDISTAFSYSTVPYATVNIKNLQFFAAITLTDCPFVINTQTTSPVNVYGTITFVPSTPSVPSSGTAQQNTNPYAVDVYVYGGALTEIQITRNGTAYTVFSVSTAIAMSGQAYRLNPSDSITVTYSTAPTWEWL